MGHASYRLSAARRGLSDPRPLTPICCSHGMAQHGMGCGSMEMRGEGPPFGDRNGSGKGPTVETWSAAGVVASVAVVSVEARQSEVGVRIYSLYLPLSQKLFLFRSICLFLQQLSHSTFSSQYQSPHAQWQVELSSARPTQVVLRLL